MGPVGGTNAPEPVPPRARRVWTPCKCEGRRRSGPRTAINRTAERPAIDAIAPPRRARVTYVINEPCIGTKDTSCVDVCPVDCIHPTPDEPDFDSIEMLFIDPEECIDCDACVEACPVDAITSEDMVPPEWQRYIEINADYYKGGRRNQNGAPT